MSPDKIENCIFLIRRQKVMLDADLAEIYGVTTKALNQAVKRNLKRFPLDFMFRLTESEMKNLRSQFVTSSHGGRRVPPYAFTEHGVVMLASLLNSKTAIQASIKVVRAFVSLRQMLETHKELARQIEKLENRVDQQDGAIHSIFEAIRRLMSPKSTPRKKIGFKIAKRK